VAPSSDSTISVIDSDTEQLYFTVAEAEAADISRAVEAARDAFDNGPWPPPTRSNSAARGMHTVRIWLGTHSHGKTPVKPAVALVLRVRPAAFPGHGQEMPRPLRMVCTRTVSERTATAATLMVATILKARPFTASPRTLARLARTRT
jgi:hypothetical protein